uniref:Aldehyde dehydrogenase n=1 Tax=Panagrolaimus superbus TaxID=310955 RepID=A0A914Y3A9_9BILA
MFNFYHLNKNLPPPPPKKSEKFSFDISRLAAKHQIGICAIEIWKIETEISEFRLVELQRQYFNSGSPTELKHRKKALQTLRKILTSDVDDLLEAIEADLRRQKGISHALEIANAIVEINYYLENLDEWAAPTYVEKTLTSALDTPMIIKESKGVVLLIGPWNYPASMILLPLIPIIAAGNTVIIKPSEVAENTAKVFDRLFTKYFEKRYLAVVQGGVSETTDLLKERYDHIMYTGCTPVAKIIMTAAAKHVTPVTLELGGKCPVVVEDDAPADIAAKRIAWGKWLNCGQTCLAPDYIITTPSMKSKLIVALKAALTEFYGTDIQKSKDYSRIINTRHFDCMCGRVSHQFSPRKTKAPILFKGGEVDRDDLFMPPILLDAHRSDIFMEDEIFGPILPIITVKDLDEAISVIRSGEKPLAAYYFTKNSAKIDKFLNETSSGGVTINDVLMHITVDTLPFGGIGHSGMGRLV